MIRRTARISLVLGLLGGAAAAVRTARSRRPTAATTAPEPSWPPIPTTGPEPTSNANGNGAAPAARSSVLTVADGAVVAEVPAAGAAVADPVVPPAERDLTVAPGPDPQPERPAEPAAAWVEASAGACPATHPVKGKRSSSIYHLPGMLNYERTRADRCYVDGAAAEADGLRIAKR